jgi:hypothetical protein
MTNQNLIASVAQIETQILLIRGQKVMLDADLAELLRSRYQGFESGSEAQYRTLSRGFYVSTHCR